MAYYLLFAASGGAAILLTTGYLVGGDIARNILHLFDPAFFQIAVPGAVITMFFIVSA